MHYLVKHFLLWYNKCCCLYYSIAQANADERLAAERRRMQVESRDLEETRQRDVERVRLEAEEGRKAAEERSDRMRVAKENLAKEVADINAKLLEERLQHDEEIGKIRMHLKSEENVSFNRTCNFVHVFHNFYLNLCSKSVRSTSLNSNTG